MKKGSVVKLLKLKRDIDRLKVGAIGKIVSTRPNGNGGKDVLVKWEGKGWHVSHPMINVEELTYG